MAVPILSPAGPLNRDGGSATSIAADQPVTFTKTGGTFSSVASASVTWTAPNETAEHIVTATNGSLEADTLIITVRGLVPQIWGWKVPKHAKKNVRIFTPEYGPTQTRGFGDNPDMHEWELGAESTSYESFILMKAFWDFHHPGRQFDLVDPILNERRRYETDSDFDFHNPDNHGNKWSWACRIKEAYPFALIT